MVFQRDVLVKDLLSECIVVDPSTSVSKVIGLMKEKGSYEVFAWVGNKIGTATIRDILRAKSPSTMKIENLLSFIPKLSPDAKLSEAAGMMADYRLRALPVVQDNAIIGKVDVKAVISRVKNSVLGNMGASKIMTPRPITISPNEKVSKAREIMVRRKIDHLPVERDRRVRGLLTSEHIVFNLIIDYGGERYVTGVPDTLKLLDYPVEAIMESHPLVCEPQTPIRDVADRMLNEGRSYSLVTLGEELHGIVTYRDFMKLIVIKEETNVPVYIVGLPDDPFEAEVAKIKFIRLVNSISKFLPGILEARSIIKTSSLEGQRRRYEVSVSVRTAKESFNYTTDGWDLPSLYDEIANAIKRTAASRKTRKKRARRDGGRLSMEE